MMKKKGRAMRLVAILIFFVLIFSAVYIVAETDHDCTGTHCPICDQLNICKITLKTVSLAVGAVVFCAALRTILCKGMFFRIVLFQKLTLVSLKVKLLD